MDDEIIDLQLNNSICEAVECFAKAATEIRIPVGKLGLLKLLVCNNCIPKFTDYEFVRKERKSDTDNDGSSKYISS